MACLFCLKLKVAIADLNVFFCLNSIQRILTNTFGLNFKKYIYCESNARKAKRNSFIYLLLN